MCGAELRLSLFFSIEFNKRAFGWSSFPSDAQFPVAWKSTDSCLIMSFLPLLQFQFLKTRFDSFRSCGFPYLQILSPSGNALEHLSLLHSLFLKTRSTNRILLGYFPHASHLQFVFWPWSLHLLPQISLYLVKRKSVCTIVHMKIHLWNEHIFALATVEIIQTCRWDDTSAHFGSKKRCLPIWSE